TDEGFLYRSKFGDIERFDSNGKLVSSVDRFGMGQTLSWDGGFLASVSSPDSGEATIYYDLMEGTVSITQPSDRTLGLTLDGDDHLESITDLSVSEERELTYLEGTSKIECDSLVVDTFFEFEEDGMVSKITIGDTVTSEMIYQVTPEARVSLDPD